MVLIFTPYTSAAALPDEMARKMEDITNHLLYTDRSQRNTYKIFVNEVMPLVEKYQVITMKSEGKDLFEKTYIPLINMLNAVNYNLNGSKYAKDIFICDRISKFMDSKWDKSGNWFFSPLAEFRLKMLLTLNEGKIVKLGDHWVFQPLGTSLVLETEKGIKDPKSEKYYHRHDVCAVSKAQGGLSFDEIRFFADQVQSAVAPIVDDDKKQAEQKIRY